MNKLFRRVLPCLSFALFIAVGAIFAQRAYQRPPSEVIEVLNAPLTPNASVSPTRDYILFAQGVRYPPITELAQPMLRLAGLRINPNTNAPHRAPYSIALTLKRISDGAEQQIALPADAHISFPQWSADGKSFAFTNTTPRGVELWIGETATGRARKIEGARINSIYGAPFQWMPDNRTLLVQLVPPTRGAPPAPTEVPDAPNAQESSGKPAPVRTYEDLLKTPSDEALFDYYATAQLAFIDAASGAMTMIGQPSIFSTVQPSPSGQFILVARIKHPYSYLHPLNAFPKEVEVWDHRATIVYKLASLPLQDQVPIEGVPTGPRDYEWQPTEAATLLWVEALDGGDPRKKISPRDRVMMLKIPTRMAPVELFKTPQRFSGMMWSERGDVALISDFDRDRRFRRTFILNTKNSLQPPRAIWELNVNDRYHNPGAPVMKTLPNNQRAMMQNGDSIYLIGQGASPEGDRPFLDRFNLMTLKTERLFQSDAASYETPVALLDDNAKQFITRRETPTDPPNFYVRTLSKSASNVSSGATLRSAEVFTSTAKPLTNFPDPTPQLRGIRKQLVTYKRPDGVQCSFTLYLPPDYKEGTRLPTVVWAYPLEYTDTATASQVTGSAQRFTTITGASHLFFLLHGYAVLDNATMPVVGDPETVNNTFIEQIVMSAKAAIDKATEMGVTDPDRVGVGGHSYGAFMTANLLAHSNLFRAGIARSGAYNRTLTPFGFQNERRTLWEAPEMYIKVSPFMYADKIKAPLLLIHGEADDNPGTFPIQSERLYQAIRGTGGTVRLVTLPLEAHGYIARESIEHTIYEMFAWFDKYVKNASPRAKPTANAAK
jgi:dipeptidyl aminopeptidase/acylaminoacyl peptidase